MVWFSPTMENCYIGEVQCGELRVARGHLDGGPGGRQTRSAPGSCYIARIILYHIISYELMCYCMIIDVVIV